MGRKKRAYSDDEEEGVNHRAAKKQRIRERKEQERKALEDKFRSEGCKDACPLCGKEAVDFLCYSFHRPYFHCSHCDLAFVPSHLRQSLADEKDVYRRHREDKNDPGFCKFIHQVLDPLFLAMGLPVENASETDQATAEALKLAGFQGSPTSTMLDYGSGPGGAVKPLSAEQNLVCTEYDPFEFPTPTLADNVSTIDTAPNDLLAKNASTELFQTTFPTLCPALRGQYDIITFTEVLKHVRNPLYVWMHLYTLTKKHGVVAVQGGICQDISKFESWCYHRDTSHITFYTRKALKYVESLFPWTMVESPNTKIVYFIKN